MLFRQLFDQDSSTYTYLLADEASRKALIIDPVFEQIDRDSTLIDELELELVWALDTHVHADHITALGLLNQRFKARTVLSERGGAVCADRLVKHGDRISFGRHELEVRETPGHTNGCLSYVCSSPGLAFTGDALLIRGCGRTDFQEGDARTLYRSVREQIFSLPDGCLVYPGHDYRGLTASSVGEEKRHNPRLAESVGEQDFAGYMAHLGLAHPKRMEQAVPANLRCGRPHAELPKLEDPDWAPLTYTFGGIWEVQPEWLEEHLPEVQVVDVREPAEFEGSLGRVPGARLLPLGSLLDKKHLLDRERPVVTVCRSGARSAQASVLLAKQGFPRVANLAGGMLRWRAQRLEAEGGAE